MSVINISRSRLINLFLSSVRNARNVNPTRSHRYGITTVLRSTPRYLSFAFLNLFYVAEAIDDKSKIKKLIEPADVIYQADDLFSLGKYEDSLKVLEQFKDSENVEILWRISRALFNMSKKKGISSSDSAAMINEAFQYIEKALKLDGNHYAIHKWMAILYDARSALSGMKSRINALPVFKKHLMRAVELNPKDATSIFMLGQYMYSIADMSWLQKTIAKTLFGNPPEASFEEAFYYFSKAEEVDPNFYSANLLMLGKTCLKLKKIEAGCYWLKCALSYPVRTDEDEAVRLEAEELLQKYTGLNTNSKDEKQTNIQ